MTGDDENNDASGLPAWIEHASLPSVLAGPAGRAVSRLIGAAVEIPAAYLEGQAKSIRASFDAKADLKRTMSAAAADLYSQDPQIVERFGRRWLSDEIVRQGNREAIAQQAVNELEEETPSNSIESEAAERDVDSDWLRKFGDYAQDVSNEDFQLLWAKILAGEIRKPGSVGRAVLDVLAHLEQDDIPLIEKYARLRVAENFIPLPRENNNLIELIRLEELGLIQGSNMGFNKTGKNQPNGVSYLKVDDKALVFIGPPAREWRMSGAVATRKLIEVANVLGFKAGREAAKAAVDILLNNDWIETIYLARVFEIEEADQIRFEPIEYFKEPKVGELSAPPGAFSFRLGEP